MGTLASYLGNDVFPGACAGRVSSTARLSSCQRASPRICFGPAGPREQWVRSLCCPFLLKALFRQSRLDAPLSFPCVPLLQSSRPRVLTAGPVGPLVASQCHGPLYLRGQLRLLIGVCMGGCCHSWDGSEHRAGHFLVPSTNCRSGACRRRLILQWRF
eukprot:9335413-Pyramimonas_sp.AAC.1